MYTRINWAIKKNGYGLLEHTLKVLKPKAAGVKEDASGRYLNY